MSRRTVVYASEGLELHAFALDAQTGALDLLSTATLPELVQYAAIDTRRGLLYVSASNRVDRHLVVALAVDPATGQLSFRGAPVVSPHDRVIHLSVDPVSGHVVLAHPMAGRLSVLALHPDGNLGAPVPQPEALDTGFFAHQAKVDPTGTGVVACALGADASAEAPEKPGVLTVFRRAGGVLTRAARVALGPGLGPRHLEYAPGRVYVVVERGNRLAVFDYADGVLSAPARFMVDTLADPGRVRPGQRAGAIRLHPHGRFLYVTNRANAVDDGTFVGGENSVALFTVDPDRGRPVLAGHFETGGIEPRTFAIDPAGRFLIVANHSTLDRRLADGRREAIPRSWAVFRIGDDGGLVLARRYERAGGDLYWIGAHALA